MLFFPALLRCSSPDMSAGVNNMLITECRISLSIYTSLQEKQAVKEAKAVKSIWLGWCTLLSSACCVGNSSNRSHLQECFSVVLLHLPLLSLCIPVLQPDDSQQFKLPREPRNFSNPSREDDLGPAACACKVSQFANMNESPVRRCPVSSHSPPWDRAATVAGREGLNQSRMLPAKNTDWWLGITTMTC